MDGALLSLLGAFLLSLIGLFAFIWSLRQGLLVENPRDASVIFAKGEIGQVDDPALAARDQDAMQDAVAPRGDPVVPADLTETEDRVAADRCHEAGHRADQQPEAGEDEEHEDRERGGTTS